ncbi:aminoimidazole riboside kinase [Alkalihalobacillus hwajinpoensis]|uniref:aminoimidazole riboside kinase n=1 Tax=Guptibacillus hwajinpoensis TaxID=208199 RepID=UPI0018844560|nr:aminoimidazole riboside kinase [Pseudalkalibacillus hwajinpoensis]MBF0706129.1 aminoimidazole riboside kinase [Pseudalkalibacillus hwajinpoensis]
MSKGVISLGEALIDFIPLDKDNLTYQKSPGGAPANVSVGLARLGVNSTFLGKVGDDVLGRFLQETLKNYGVDVSTMILTESARTGVVFVTNAENGERSFDFYINPSADRFLHAEEISDELFERHRILHFGSISMISEPSRSATKVAVEKAKENGLLISYDPNLRLGLWESEERAKETIVSMLSEADILKLSEEELTFITGEEAIEDGIKKLAHYRIPVIFITMGGEGSLVYTPDYSLRVPAMKVKAVDTTGAGDAFVSGILNGFNEYEGSLSDLSREELKRMTQFASVSGALAAATKGAMTALPTKTEVEEILLKESK